MSTMKILAVLSCTMMVLAGAAVYCIWSELANHDTCCPTLEKFETGTDLVNRSVSCSEGWFQFKGRCFYYVPTPMSWAKSERNCLSMGANLASLHNIEEYREIQRQTANRKNKETWIGGSNAQQVNVWLWSDGSMFNYSNWCPGEPSNGTQRCLQMNYGDHKCWDDNHCDSHRPSVCAKKAQGILG